MTMYDALIEQMNQVKSTASAALGAAGGAAVVMVIEYFKWRRDDEEISREEFRELDKKIKLLEAEIAALQGHHSAAGVGAGVSVAGFAPFSTPIVLERQLSPLQQVLRSQITNANILVQGGTGAGGTAALLSMGGVGELHTVSDFAVRIVAAASGAAGGVPMARFVPPTTLKGVIRVRLTPAGTYNSPEQLKPCYIINYGPDGLTVVSIDFGAATGVTPTASGTFDLQVRIEAAPVLATISPTSEYTNDVLHPATAGVVGLVNVS